MKKNSSFIVTGLCFILLPLYNGCAVTIAPGDYYKNYDKQAEIIMNDSSKYEIASNWTVDSTSHIRGKGIRIYGKNDSSKISRVSIPQSDIRRLVIIDNVTPIYVEVAVVTALFIYELKTNK